MEQICIRHTELPGTSALFRDYLYNFTDVAEFYAHAPTLESVSEVARGLRFPQDRRQAIVEALRKTNGDAGADVRDSLDRLSDPDAVVVATGQQVGLFGGPAFSVYKALAAAKWCDRLREQGIPAVPVFWLATEDHDIEEVDHAWLAGWDEPPERIRAQYTHPHENPVGGAEISAIPFGDVRELWRKYPHGEKTARELEQHYGGAATFRSGFASLMRDLLSGRGVVFLDPMQPEIRALAAPLISRAIGDVGVLNERLRLRSEALQERGYHAQVHVTPATCPFFTFEGGRRTAVKRSGGQFRIGREPREAEQLLQRVSTRPDDFSPNALLRPVMQDFLLPTAAYIGGPAEIAYLAQSGVLYEHLLDRSPVFVPRASFTVLGSRASKVMQRYQLGLTDCLRPAADLRRHIAARLVPEALGDQVSAAKRGVEAALAPLAPEVGGFDPTLERSVRATETKIRSQLEKLHGKVARQMLRRDEQATRDTEYIQHWVYPRRTMQERVYSAATFLARWGTPFLDDVYAKIEPTCPDHQILHMG